MRIVTYGAAVSLDGFLAGVNGAIDWLHFSKDVQQVTTDYWKDVDAVLMGRKTYEFSVAMSDKQLTRNKKKTNQTRGDGPKKLPAGRTYVFSRTLKKLGDPGAELISSDAAEFLRDLKQQPGKGICLLGGGELAQALLAADLVDEVRLNIHPVLLGSGIPTFHDAGHRVKLAMTECRMMEGDCILASYKVLHEQ
jgi:dihydrofolate reductase